jgi:outer membrane lipoprotein SlyB
MRKAIILAALILTGCEQQQQPVRTYTDDQGVKHEVVKESSGGGFGERLAQTAVMGAVGGAAAGAASRATDHAINRWQERREARRASGRVYHGSVVRRR